MPTSHELRTTAKSQSGAKTRNQSWQPSEYLAPKPIERLFEDQSEKTVVGRDRGCDRPPAARSAVSAPRHKHDLIRALGHLLNVGTGVEILWLTNRQADVGYWHFATIRTLALKGRFRTIADIGRYWG
jgi:hypothetical protein